MSEFKLTTVEEMEAATNRLLETGAKVGADAWQYRVKNQTPHCKFGETGVCCRICAMGPCRITPESTERNLRLRRTRHRRKKLPEVYRRREPQHHLRLMGREICHTLYESAADGDYKVKDPEKLIRIAKEWGIETEGKDIYDLAHEVAYTGLMEYGKPFGYQRFMEETAGAHPGAVEKERDRSQSYRSGGCYFHAHDSYGMLLSSEALIKQSIRAGLCDGWGGSMMGTEFSDVLFGTPKPIDTEANLGVMNAENVNIVVHGHDPSLSEMICEYADDPEMIAYAKEMGAKGITVSGVCCTSNEVAMRRGIPMAGNFLQQENVVLTGACEAIVVDVQCIFPGPWTPEQMFPHQVHHHLSRSADAGFRIHPLQRQDRRRERQGDREDGSGELQEQKPELVHIPDMKQKATLDTPWRLS